MDDATEGTVRRSDHRGMDRVVDAGDGNDEPDPGADRAVVLLV